MKNSTWWWAANLLGLVVLLVLLILSRTQHSDLQADYDAISQQMTNISAVFPPDEFASTAELQAWLNANPISEQPTATYVEWFSSAFQLQRDALNDGYIISVDFDYDQAEDALYINCQTVIDGWIWYWDPETDDITQYTHVGPIN